MSDLIMDASLNMQVSFFGHVFFVRWFDIENLFFSRALRQTWVGNKNHAITLPLPGSLSGP